MPQGVEVQVLSRAQNKAALRCCFILCPGSKRKASLPCGLERRSDVSAIPNAEMSEARPVFLGV